MYNFVAKAVLNIVKATSNQYFVFNIYIYINIPFRENRPEMYFYLCLLVFNCLFLNVWHI